MSSAPLRLTRTQQTFVLVVAWIGGFLGTFLSSAINIALPLIGQDFNLSAVKLSWVSLAYILTAGATLMPMGRLADMFGRLRVFTGGMVIFVVIAFASAFAPSGNTLIALRVIHGLGLAITSGTSTALVTLAMPPEKRGRALGLNVAGVYLGLTLGPVLGGLIVHNLGWRSLFLIVGALGLPNLGLALWKLRHIDWREAERGRFDLAGSVIYAVSLTAVLAGFSLFPAIAGIAALAGGVLGLIVFVWWEDRTAEPILHINLFRKNRVFAFSNVAAFINYAATFAMTFLMSLYLQYNRGLDAQTAGFVLVAGTFVQAVCSPIAGRLADRVEARWLASTGMAICVLGLLALTFVGDTTPYWYIITILCVLGVGFAFFSSPITSTVMGSVDKRWAGVASATLGTMRLAGQNMSMGVATLVLALEVGRHAIGPADYPQVLTSVRTTFLIFTVLCALGVAASLVGPKREESPTSSREHEPAPEEPE